MYEQNVTYINLSQIISRVTEDGDEQRDLVNALSHADFCFGTNAFSLVELSAICLVWEQNGYDEYSSILMNKLSPYKLINLEG